MVGASLSSLGNLLLSLCLGLTLPPSPSGSDFFSYLASTGGLSAARSFVHTVSSLR